MHDPQENAIGRDGMMEPMLRACPSFAPVWLEFLRDWQDDPLLEQQDGRLPLYLALSDLANHLIFKLEHGDTSDFPAVFGVVERWHREGTGEVREAAAVGLIEDLQNENRYRSSGPSAFLPWLGPETRRWWHKLERSWSHGELLPDE